jgi:two-component system response regulator AtoC
MKQNEDVTRVFIVDDDPVFSKALETYLKKEVPNVEVASFSNGESSLHELHRSPDLLLLDYRLDSEFAYAWDGLQILKKINNIDPGLSVVVMSAKESVDTAMNCIKMGAMEYVVKNEQAFPKIKGIVSELKQEIKEEKEEEELEEKSNMPAWLGLLLLLILLIFFLYRL